MKTNVSLFKDDAPISVTVDRVLIGGEAAVVVIGPRQVGKQLWHPRLQTTAGAEIDLLLEVPGHGLWVVEVKRSLSGRPN